MQPETDCSGSPYCNRVPFAWGKQSDGYCYDDPLGPGGQAHPRYAQTMCDGHGWCKQLGAMTLGQNPYTTPAGKASLVVSGALAGAVMGGLGAYIGKGKRIGRAAATVGAVNAVLVGIAVALLPSEQP